MASPFVTGGGGFSFEDQVLAFYLACMLKPSGVHGLHSSFVLRMLGAQQGKHGWPLDDVLVQANNLYDELAHLSIQLKHTLVVTTAKSKPEFSDIVRRAWDTFKTTEFGKEQDRFGAAVAETNKTKCAAIVEMCDWAQFAGDNADFFAEKISLEDYSNSLKRDIYAQVTQILEGHLDRPAEKADLLKFFKHFTILQFDTNEQSGIHSYLARECCRDALVSEEAGRATDLWNALQTYAGKLRRNAGRVDREGLLSHLRLNFRLRHTPGGASGIAALAPQAIAPSQITTNAQIRPSGTEVEALDDPQGTATPNSDDAWNEALDKLRLETKKLGYITVGRKLEALQAQGQWRIAGERVRAKALRLRGYVAMGKHEFSEAILCADKADALDGGTSNTLRASVTLREHGTARALIVLGEPKNLEQKFLKIAILLEEGLLNEKAKTTDQAAEILGELETECANDPEWLRLKAIERAMHGDSLGALASIRKAEEIAGEYVGIKHFGAAIRYQCSRSPALSYAPPPWPEPLVAGLFRHDDNSRELRAEARRNLRDIAHIERHPWDAANHRLWTLACLANDPETLAEAQEYLRGILQEIPIDPRALVWAVQRGLSFDNADVSTRLRRELTQPKVDVGVLNSLLMCLVEAGKEGHARTALNRYSPRFDSEHDKEVIQGWRWRLATRKEKASIPPREDLSLLAKAQNSTNVDELREVVLSTLNEPEHLLVIASEIARRGLWSALEGAVDTLAESIRTDESIRLAAYIHFNNHDFLGALRIVDDYVGEFRGGVLTRDLAALQLNSLIESDNIPKAIQVAEATAKASDLVFDKMQWAKLLIKSGDTKKGAPLVREILTAYPWTDEEAIGISKAVASEDLALARDLFNLARVKGIAPEFLGSAISLGYRLGLDQQAHEILDAAAKIPEVREKAGIQMASIADLKAHLQERKEASTNLSQMYRAGKVPIHMIVGRIGLTLSEIWASAFTTEDSHPLLIRHGNRPREFFVDGIPAPDGIAIDITALLTADWMGLLDALHGAAGGIFVPEAVPMELQRMADAVRHQQPSHLQQLKKIAEEVREGRIQVWQATEQVRTSRIGRVEFSLKDEGDDEPSGGDLTLGALAEELVRRGVITESTCGRIRSSLSGWQEIESRVDVRGLGGLVFSDNTIETLFTADIYNKVQGEYSLYIEREFLDHCEVTVRVAQRGEEHSARLRRILAWLVEGQRSGWLKLVGARNGVTNGPVDNHGRDIAAEIMLQSLFAKGHAGRWVWVDDRCLTGYPRCEAGTLVSTFEVLQWFRATDKIPAERYFELLLEMRRRKMLLVPTSDEEVLHWLRAARIDNGFLQETAELAAIRVYVNSVLLFEPELDLKPDREEGDKKVEFPCVAELNRLCSDCLRVIWIDHQRSDDVAIAMSNWVWDSLRIERFERLPIMKQTEESRRQLWSMFAVQILLVAFALDDNDQRGRDAGTRRSTMIRWLEGKLFDLTEMGDEGVARSISDHFTRSLVDNFMGRPGEHTNDERRHLQLEVQLFLQELPEALRRLLKENKTFSKAFDIKLSDVIHIGTLKDKENVRFKAELFWTAINKAVTGTPAEIRSVNGDAYSISVDSDAQVIVSQGEDGFQLSDTGFQLLSSDEGSRKRFLDQHLFEICVPGEHVDVEGLVKSGDAAGRVRRFREAQELCPGGRYALLRSATSPPLAKISFEGVLPAAVGRYLSDLGLTEGGFPDWEKSTENLLSIAGIGATFERVAGLPVALPASLVWAFQQLKGQEAVEFLNEHVALRPSPMRLLRAIELVETLGDPSAELVSIAERVYKSITDNWATDSEAFVVLLAWSQRAWERDEDWKKLPNWQRLACIWVHADRIAAELIGAQIDGPWISEHFESTHARRVVDLLVWEKEFETDVAAPGNVHGATLLASGLSATSKSGGARRLQIPADVVQLFNLRAEGHLNSAAWLIEIRDDAPNAMGSYLVGALDAQIAEIVEENLKRTGPSEGLTRANVVDHLRTHAQESTAWVLLGAIGALWYGQEEYQAIAVAAAELPFPSLDADQSEWVAMFILAKIIPMLDASDRAKYEARLLEFAKELSRGSRNPSREYYQGREKSPTGVFIEFVAAFVRSPSAEEAVTKLSSLIGKVVAIWPSSAGLWRLLLNQVMTSMSYSSIELLWRPLVQLRALK